MSEQNPLLFKPISPQAAAKTVLQNKYELFSPSIVYLNNDDTTFIMRLCLIQYYRNQNEVWQVIYQLLLASILALKKKGLDKYKVKIESKIWHLRLARNMVRISS